MNTVPDTLIAAYTIATILALYIGFILAIFSGADAESEVRARQICRAKGVVYIEGLSLLQSWLKACKWIYGVFTLLALAAIIYGKYTGELL